MESRYNNYGPTVLRISLGLLFLLLGVGKLLSPSGIIALVGSIGFPLAPLFGWIVLLCEIVFGAALIAGWKIKYTIWPLLILLSIATIFVVIPSTTAASMAGLLFHILAIAGLVSLALTGPGAWSVDKN